MNILYISFFYQCKIFKIFLSINYILKVKHIMECHCSTVEYSDANSISLLL